MRRTAFIAIAVAVYFFGSSLSARAQNQEQANCARYQHMVRTYGTLCLFTWDWQTAGDPNAPVTRVCCNTGNQFGGHQRQHLSPGDSHLR